MRRLCCPYARTLTSISEASSSTKKQLAKLNSELVNLSRSGHHEDALHLFDEIHRLHHRLKPDNYTLSAAISASSHLRDLAFGDQLHAYAIRTGYKAHSHVSNTLLFLYSRACQLVSVKRVFSEIGSPDAYSWTTLLSAYARLGDLHYAFKVFDEMPQRDVAVWNAMITGCVENGYEEDGIDLFREMHVIGVRHDNYSFASVLSVCSWDMLHFGRQVHCLVVKTGFLVTASVVNSLVSMFFNCGDVADAYLMFEEAENLTYDQITFNVMIDGLMKAGRVEEASEIFKKMLKACFNPTQLTFVSFMSLCSCARVGHQMHAQALKTGLGQCTPVSNATMNMYSSLADLNAVQTVFKGLEEKDIISWNSMISSYAQENFGESAMAVYLDMQRAGIKPDEYTLGSLLTSSELNEIIEILQALALKNGLAQIVDVSNALISAYSKHGKIMLAYLLFQISHKNLISWNAIISGLFMNGFPVEALEQFSELVASEFEPNEYTLSVTLSTCASISALKHGKELHAYIIKQNIFSGTALGNALITLYTKCGILGWSLEVFYQIAAKDIISWNSLISAYAHHGKGREAVHCFNAMKDMCIIKPDQATFTTVLSACSHSGLVDDGVLIFNSMVNEYGVTPEEDHISCLVDLLSRAGYLDEAERVIDSLEIKANSNIWWCLFSACAAQGNLRLGRMVARLLLERERNNPSVYVLLSNIYAAAGQWEEAAEVRQLMENFGVTKQRGSSWISL